MKAYCSPHFSNDKNLSISALLQKRQQKPRHVLLWQKIVENIFNFGHRDQTLTQELAAIPLSKQFYYDALSAAIHEHLIRISSLIEKEFSKSTNQQSTVTNQHCEEKEDHKIYEKLVKLGPSLFNSCSVLQEIIKSHESNFGWGCGCHRKNCRNFFPNKGIEKSIIVYVKHIYKNEIKPWSRCMRKNKFELLIPSDSQCIMNFEFEIAKQQKQFEGKKQKTNKNKTNKNQDQNIRQNEKQLQQKSQLQQQDCQIVELQQLLQKLQFQSLPNRLQCNVHQQWIQKMQKEINYLSQNFNLS